MTGEPPDLPVAREEAGVAFWIHVTPRSRQAALGGRNGDALRVAGDGAALAGRLRALAGSGEVA